MCVLSSDLLSLFFCESAFSILFPLLFFVKLLGPNESASYVRASLNVKLTPPESICRLCDIE